MKRGYQYKLKPTFKQQRLLEQMFGCVRYIYNWGLKQRVTAFTSNGEYLSAIDLIKMLPDLKKTPGMEWLKEPANESLQQSLRHTDNAFTNFFKKRAEFPVYKSKKHSKHVCKFNQNIHIDFSLGRIKVAKLGWIKMCKNREFDLSDSRIISVTVTKDKCGTYWASVLVEDSTVCRPKSKVCKERAVGVDLGIKDYAILSDGKKFGNPKFLEQNLLRLKYLQQHFSKSQKGSNRRERRRKKIATIHRHIHNQRVHQLHEITSYLVKHYDTICLEDLNIKGMMKNHRRARSIQSASWGEFVRQMVYKSEWYGKNLVFIGRFDPSSQLCSVCGYRNRKIKDTRIREWTCPECGTHHDRDINAAINILNFGLHKQSLVGFENKIPSMSGINTDVEVTVG